jgi:hypothetical protein
VSTSDPAITRFVGLCEDALAAGRWLKLVLVHPTGLDLGAEPASGLQRIMVRPVALKDGPHLSFLLRYPTRDITKNHPLPEGLARLQGWLHAGAFRNAHLHTPDEEVQLAISKKGKATVRVGRHATPAPAASEAGHAAPGALPDAQAADTHNRAKQRHLSLSRPFLHALGVTDAQGHLIPAMARKWKQINKFVEVFEHALARSRLAGRDDVHVVDFGSGKGYLTFAVHDWLSQQGQHPQVTGVELRQELVALCQNAIAQLGLQGMHYEQGDVRAYHPARLDVMIALHACDVATDYAIHLGIRAGAEIILCSPCCHKEIRPQLLSPHPLRPLLKHGIHQAQEAEMLTDGLRALLLDAAGYDTQVFEFISLEHTNKNKMILAVKRAQPRQPDEVIAQIHDLKAFYGVQQQCLETLLRQDGLLPP